MSVYDKQATEDQSTIDPIPLAITADESIYAAISLDTSADTSTEVSASKPTPTVITSSVVICQ